MAEDKSDKGFTVVDKRIKAEEEGAPAEERVEVEEEAEKTASSETASDPAKTPEEENIHAERAYKEAAECVEEATETSPGGGLPPVSFPTFLLSLHSSALIHLGILPDPLTNKQNRELEMARQNIDLLEILEQKTRGNLTNEESKLMENILYELRMAYIEVSKQVCKGEVK